MVTESATPDEPQPEPEPERQPAPAAESEVEPHPAGRPKKRWADLTPAQKAGVVVLASAQVALLAAAATDLVRRPAEQVRGPKWAWAPVLAVNFVGPVAYLTCGRRRHAGRWLG